MNVFRTSVIVAIAGTLLAAAPASAGLVTWYFEGR